MSAQRRMVFDVESIGLHGEGFAVAWVILLGDQRAGQGWSHCNPDKARGTEEGRKWVAENVIGSELDAPVQDCPPAKVLDTPAEVRDYFWGIWENEKAQGAQLWADCTWPVEARFLIACVEGARPHSLSRTFGGVAKDIDPSAREWKGPYPLLDIATLSMALGEDPLAARERLVDEKPDHHPLADARQSARILIEFLGKLGVEL